MGRQGRPKSPRPAPKGQDAAAVEVILQWMMTSPSMLLLMHTYRLRCPAGVVAAAIDAVGRIRWAG